MPDSQIHEPATVIAPNTLIKGEVTFLGPATVLGRVEGHIRAEHMLEIGPGASVLGDVVAAIVDIQGQIDGNVTASECVRLGPTARLTGELRAANLAISEGATFIGKVCVGTDADVGAGEAREQQVPAEAALPAAHVSRPVDPAATLASRVAAMQETEPQPEQREPVIRVMTQNLQQAAAAQMQAGAAARQPRIIKAR